MVVVTRATWVVRVTVWMISTQGKLKLKDFTLL